MQSLWFIFYRVSTTYSNTSITRRPTLPARRCPSINPARPSKRWWLARDNRPTRQSGPSRREVRRRRLYRLLWFFAGLVWVYLYQWSFRFPFMFYPLLEYTIASPDSFQRSIVECIWIGFDSEAGEFETEDLP